MVIRKITNKNKSKGFTIVELLIVIVVIAILAAITTVSFSGIRQGAATAKTRQNAASVQSVAQAFHAANGSYPTTPEDFTSGDVATLPPNITLLTGEATLYDDVDLENSIDYDYLYADSNAGDYTLIGARISYYSFKDKSVASIYLGKASESDHYSFFSL